MTNDLQAIRDRLNAISPGAWQACKDGECACGMVWAGDDVLVHIPPTFDQADRIPIQELQQANAAFIAHAPEDIGVLLARIEQAEAERDALKAHLYQKHRTTLAPMGSYWIAIVEDDTLPPDTWTIRAEP